MPNVLEATGDWSLSPYDYDFSDSVSMRSSTIVDSEVAAARVRQHEMTQQFRVPIDPTPVTNSISLQIQVLNNGTLAASEVNNIERVFSRKPLNEKIRSCAKTRHRQWQIVFMIIVLLVIVVIAITSVLTFYKKLNETENPTEMETTSQETTSHTQPTSTALSTTTESSFKFVPRYDWDNKSNLSMKYVRRLKPPIERLIIMDTQQEAWNGCSEFLRERHKLASQEYLAGSRIRGIRENFFISYAGTVYEARGFVHVGQHTYDQQLTNYNLNAIGISFIGNYSNRPLEPSSEAAFHEFVHKSVEMGRISENYSLYHQSQLSLQQNLSENTLYKTVQSWDHWKATPAIISKKEWGGLERKGNPGYSSDMIQNKVVVGHSNGSTCSDLASCSQIMREMQLQDREKHGDIKYNFVFGGADLIFQGRSFDYRSVVTTMSFDVLFIGRYTDEQPPKSLMKAFEAFLQFAVDLGKLTVDYKLYGQRQLIEDTESPGDKLYEALQSPPFDSHFDFRITTPEPCRIGCSIRM